MLAVLGTTFIILGESDNFLYVYFWTYTNHTKGCIGLRPFKEIQNLTRAGDILCFRFMRKHNTGHMTEITKVS